MSMINCDCMMVIWCWLCVDDIYHLPSNFTVDYTSVDVDYYFLVATHICLSMFIIALSCISRYHPRARCHSIRLCPGGALRNATIAGSCCKDVAFNWCRGLWFRVYVVNVRRRSVWKHVFSLLAIQCLRHLDHLGGLDIKQLRMVGDFQSRIDEHRTTCQATRKGCIGNGYCIIWYDLGWKLYSLLLFLRFIRISILLILLYHRHL